jgi:hypothetical protein
LKTRQIPTIPAVDQTGGVVVVMAATAMAVTVVTLIKRGTID